LTSSLCAPAVNRPPSPPFDARARTPPQTLVRAQRGVDNPPTCIRSFLYLPPPLLLLLLLFLLLLLIATTRRALPWRYTAQVSTDWRRLTNDAVLWTDLHVRMQYAAPAPRSALRVAMRGGDENNRSIQ
jgi:hypothetical protein